MQRRKGTWSTITNISDRDIVVSLLRSAGHGNVLDRKIDLVLSSKVKIDIYGNVVELTLGRKDQSSFRYQQQQQQQLRRRRRRRQSQQNGNNNNDEQEQQHDELLTYWDLSESVGKLAKLEKLVLFRCRCIPASLNDLSDLNCLELHFCHGNSMAERQQELLTITSTTRSYSTAKDPPDIHDRNINGKNHSNNNVPCRLSRLTTLVICDGIWSDQSIYWMKWMISTTSSTVNTGFSTEDNEPCCNSTTSKETCGTAQLQVVRFSFLRNELLNAILKFLSPWNTTMVGLNRCSANDNGNQQVNKKATICLPPATSCLKRLAWIHSGINDQGLERLLRGVVLPFHPNLSGIDVSGNQIRSLQILLEPEKSDSSSSYTDSAVATINGGEYNQCNSNGRRNYISNDCDHDDVNLYLRQKPLQVNHEQIRYHSLRTLNLQHNPILKQRTSHPREQQAFEALLLHYFPLLGSLTPSWEDWDAPIEYLLRINRGGRVLVEGTTMPSSLPFLSQGLKSIVNRAGSTKNDRTEVLTSARKESSSLKTTRHSKIPLSLWPFVLHSAYKTSSRSFLPPRDDATAMYYLVRNGPTLSEIFATAR